MKKFTIFFTTLISFVLSLKSQSPVSNVSSNSITVNINGVKLKIPYYRNNSISSPNNNFKRAIVTIHGTNRNADDYFNNMVSVATNAGKLNSTLIIAPQFLMEMDIDTNNLGADYLFWTGSGWKEGRNSITTGSNPRAESISSYSVIDTIIYRIAQNFPSITSITVTGHSAGGQVVNRYAATNKIEQGVNPCLQYVIANPSSYLYMTNERYDTTTKTFSVPTTSCTDYDEWHKGFYKLQTQCPYAYNVGVTDIRSQYSQRHVVYLLGMLDTDPNDSDLDISCSGMIQGTQRFERGMVYYKFLKYYYGNAITQTHLLDSVPGVGHSNLVMYDSSVGRSYLFNNNPCGITTFTNGLKINKNNTKIYPNPSKDRVVVTTTVDHSFIEVFNSGGQLVQKKLCNNNLYELDLSEYRSLLFVKVTNELGTSIEKVVILK